MLLHCLALAHADAKAAAVLVDELGSGHLNTLSRRLALPLRSGNFAGKFRQLGGQSGFDRIESCCSSIA
jgi:hypothetical protein